MIKAGDKVEFKDTPENVEFHEMFPNTHPQPGTRGEVLRAENNMVFVFWDSTESLSWVHESTVEKLERCVIKDSGQRTEFATGAVRDMHIGKGRMDLLPMNAIMAVSKHCENGAIKYGEHNVDRGIPAHSLIDSGMRHAAKFMVGETDEDHLVAAVWNFLWLLEMRTTHPELMDIPWRPKDEQEKE